MMALLAAAGFGWQQFQLMLKDRATAVALVSAITAPRVIFDSLPLEQRYDGAVEEVAELQRRPEKEVAESLRRYASGGILGTKRVGFDAYLAQMATRRFELGIASLREVATAARNSAKPEIPAWRLLADVAILEFARGRAVVAEPIVQQAFEQANKLDSLDTPEAAGLLTVCGAIHMSRGRPLDAEPYFRRAVSILRKAEGADLRDCARTLTHYGQSIAAQGFPEEAETLYGEALSKAAQFRRVTGRHDRTEPLLEQTYRKLLRDRGLADAEIARLVGAAIESE